MDEIVLGRYRLVRRLGVGGMADVWLAVDVQGGPDVAVKRLHPHLAEDPAMVERLRREAVAAASVRHPNIVRVLDSGPGVVVLEYVAGQPLAQRLRDGPMPLPDVEQIAAELADALATVHAAGLVHRDVSPANVILGADGRARLADFGIARPVDEEMRLTATGDLLATLRYAAPEVLGGRPADPASDVWSLGSVLHEALAGVAPYPGSSAAELVTSRSGPPPRLGGGRLSELIAEMLDPDPARRPSAASVAQRLAPQPMAVTEAMSLPVASLERGRPRSMGPVKAIPQRPAVRPVSMRLGLLGGAAVLVVAGLVLAGTGGADPLATFGSPTAPAPTTVTASAPLPSATDRPSITPTAAPARTGSGHGQGKSHGPKRRGHD